MCFKAQLTLGKHSLTVFEVPHLRFWTPHEDQLNVVVLLVGSNETNKQASGKDNI